MTVDPYRSIGSYSRPAHWPMSLVFTCFVTQRYKRIPPAHSNFPTNRNPHMGSARERSLKTLWHYASHKRCDFISTLEATFALSLNTIKPRPHQGVIAYYFTVT